ncbi:MAG: hypothetical protein KBA71_09985 [Opitutaceae bacterium]|nr:hypothetical protein [Opitutaceae bacterium]
MRFLQMLIAIVVGVLALAAALIGAFALALVAVLASARRRFSRTGTTRNVSGGNERGFPASGSGDVIDVVAHEVGQDPADKRAGGHPLQPTHARAL